MDDGGERAERSHDTGGDSMPMTAVPDQATRGGEDEDYQFIPIHEAAARLHVSESTIRSWFDHGIIRGPRLPRGTRRIPRSEVERLVQEIFGVPRNMGPMPTSVDPAKGAASEQPEPLERYPNF